jgi:hypothetical protein
LVADTVEGEGLEMDEAELGFTVITEILNGGEVFIKLRLDEGFGMGTEGCGDLVGDSIHNTLLQWTGKEGMKAGTNGAGAANNVNSGEDRVTCYRLSAIGALRGFPAEGGERD